MTPEHRSGRSSSVARSGLLSLALAALPGLARAQELEPRAYSPSPVGANFLVAGYGYQSGEILFDPSLPITEASARVNGVAVGYGRTFGLFGRSASVAASVPYAWGHAEGNLAEVAREIYRSGLADARLRVAVNLLGGPALSPGDFAARRPGTTLGASLVVVVPTGQYDPTKLISIGSNRWAFKPELGLSHPAGRFFLELYAGVWLFTPNHDAYGGTRRAQDPLLTAQAHVVYTIRPRLWVSGSATFYTGGRTYSDGVPGDTRQENSRVGLTFSAPFGRRHSVKLGVSRGASTRVGQDFRTIGIAYQYLWLDGR